jgi:tetratricopeptide (TPR) repeat protein
MLKDPNEVQPTFTAADKIEPKIALLSKQNFEILVSTTSLENLLQKGLEKAQQNNIVEAVACFKQVVESYPCHENALLWLGNLSSTPLQSLDYYSQVIRLDPHNETAREQFRLVFNKVQETQVVKKAMTDKTMEISAEKILPRRVATRIPWIGEVLLEAEVITYEQLEIALEKQQELAFKKRWKPLGEILIQLNFIKRYQLEDALQFQQEHDTN